MFASREYVGTALFKGAGSLRGFLPAWLGTLILTACVAVPISYLEVVTQLEVIKLKVEAKASAQRLSDGLKNIVVNALLALIRKARVQILWALSYTLIRPCLQRSHRRMASILLTLMQQGRVAKGRTS